MEYRDARLIAARGGRFGGTGLTKVFPCHVFSLIFAKTLDKNAKISYNKLIKRKENPIMTGKKIVTRAKEIGKMCTYWYGAKRQIPTLNLANILRRQNPSVWTEEYFDSAVKDIGSDKLVCDCSGLVCGAYDIPDVGTSTMLESFSSMVSIPAPGHFIPGMIGWKKGHCGIIIDAYGHIAEMRGLRWDFCTNRTFSECGFTRVLYSPSVDYDICDPGWYKANGYWYYKKTNGLLARNEFLKINGSWYYFNATSEMVTGYFRVNNKRYCATENGLLKSGVVTSTELSAYELIH